MYSFSDDCSLPLVTPIPQLLNSSKYIGFANDFPDSCSVPSDVTSVFGIGNANAAKLAALGVNTVFDTV